MLLRRLSEMSEAMTIFFRTGCSRLLILRTIMLSCMTKLQLYAARIVIIAEIIFYSYANRWYYMTVNL